MTLAKQIQNQIYGKVLGAIIRGFLQVIAGALGAYGVNEVMQKELLDASVPLVVAAIFSLLSLGWSYLQKKAELNIKLGAMEAETGTPLGVVENEAINNSPGPNFVGKY